MLMSSSDILAVSLIIWVPPCHKPAGLPTVCESEIWSRHLELHLPSCLAFLPLSYLSHSRFGDQILQKCYNWPLPLQNRHWGGGLYVDQPWVLQLWKVQKTFIMLGKLKTATPGDWDAMSNIPSRVPGNGCHTWRQPAQGLCEHC